MTADDLRAIPEACDAAGNRVGWVPVPVATRDALADLIEWVQHDAEHHRECGIKDCRCGLDAALAALDGTP